ncbi:MAG: hypothetical protein AAF191_20840 [Verrucomicrobiota bacterium]
MKDEELNWEDRWSSFARTEVPEAWKDELMERAFPSESRAGRPGDALMGWFGRISLSVVLMCWSAVAVLTWTTPASDDVVRQTTEVEEVSRNVGDWLKRRQEGWLLSLVEQES